MSTTVRASTTVNTGGPFVPEGSQGRHVVTLSNGNCIMVVGDGPRTLYIYESADADRTTWTLRQTVSLAANYSIDHVSIAAYANNDIGIAYTFRDSNGADANGSYSIGLSFIKMTYAGYSLGSTELTFGASSSYQWFYYGQFDMDISDAGVPYIIFSFRLNNGVAAWVRTLARRASDGAWVQLDQTQIFNSNRGSWQAVASHVSITCLSASGTTRAFVTAWDCISQVDGMTSADTGVVLNSGGINESTMAVLGWNQRAQYCAGYHVYNELYGSGFPTSRGLNLFRNPSNVDEWVLGIMHGVCGNNKANTLLWTRGSWAPSGAWAVTAGPGEWRTNLGDYAIDIPGSMAMTCGPKGQINYYWGFIQSNYKRIGNASVTPDASSGATGVLVTTGKWWDGAATQSGSVSAGGNRNNGLGVHDTKLLYDISAQTARIAHRRLLKPQTISGLSPEGGTNVPSATPTLTAILTGRDYWAHTNFKLHFQFSQDQTFGGGTRDYIQSNDKMVDMIGHDSSAPLTVTDTLPENLKLASGIWFIRARLIDALDSIGDWTTQTRSFIIGHPPSATVYGPVGGQLLDYGSGIKTFSWGFSDTSATDSQTAYQIRLHASNSAGSVLYDSGKVVSTAKSAQITVPASYKNQTLYWEVRLWDTDDAAGLYSSGSSYFQVVDPASASMSSPASGSVLTTGIPTLRAVFTANPGRKIKEWVFAIYQQGKPVWQSERFYGEKISGDAVTVIMPSGILNNNSAYTAFVNIVDDAGITSASSPVTFTTAWTSPNAPVNPTVDTSHFNTDGEGWVQLTWPATGIEAEFSGWAVYRQDDMIDPYTQQVLQVGKLKLLDVVYSQIGSYRDYKAPSSVKSTYVIRQQVNRGGFVLESSNTTGTSAFPLADTYWLIDLASSTPTATKLWLVTADDFSEEQEESEYVVIGGGRHVDKGELLGPKGTLALQLRGTGGLTARQKRLRLLDLQNRKTTLILRNPFGDVLNVNISGMSVGRIAGTGLNEFCDVTIPYSKVGA